MSEGSGSELAPRGGGELTREKWITTQAGRIKEILSVGADEPMAEDEALRLATLMHDMDVDDPLSGVEPAVVIMRELLMQQGLDDVTAIVVARALMRLDMNKLTISARMASELLDVSTVTLLRHRQNERWLPAAEHKSEGEGGKLRSESIVYWLAGILHVIAWRRKHPRTGGSTVWFPEQIRHPAN